MHRRTFQAAGILAALAWPDSRHRAAAAPNGRGTTIKSIDRTTVRIPFREVPARNMDREIPHWRYSEVTTVELSDGVKGHGETLLYYTWGATEDADVERALGRNPVDLMWDDSLGAGLQMAIFDAVAKSADVPVHRLLGDQVHRRTPLAWWNIDTSTEDMVSECRTAMKAGYTAYKTKGRPWFDVRAQIAAVRKALPESFHIAFDFNDTLLDAEQGIPILKELAVAPQIHIWETPIFQKDVAGNVAIRKATPNVAVAMHYGNPAPAVVAKSGCCDGFVIGGGATRVMQRGGFAGQMRMPFWLQLVGTGITAAWSLHFGAVLQSATWPAVNCHQLYEHDLLADPIEVKYGMAAVPDGPGIGHEIDWDAVEKYRVEKPRSRPEPERLIETTWPDGRRMWTANTGSVNFMLKNGQDGKIPYFEPGVDTRLVPNDGSAEWRKRYERARGGAYMER